MKIKVTTEQAIKFARHILGSVGRESAGFQIEGEEVQTEPLPDPVERVARRLREIYYSVSSYHEVGDFRELARKTLAAGLDPDRLEGLTAGKELEALTGGGK